MCALREPRGVCLHRKGDVGDEKNVLLAEWCPSPSVAELLIRLKTGGTFVFMRNDIAQLRRGSAVVEAESAHISYTCPRSRFEYGLFGWYLECLNLPRTAQIDIKVR